ENTGKRAQKRNGGPPAEKKRGGETYKKKKKKRPARGIKKKQKVEAPRGGRRRRAAARRCPFCDNRAICRRLPSVRRRRPHGAAAPRPHAGSSAECCPRPRGSRNCRAASRRGRLPCSSFGRERDRAR